MRIGVGFYSLLWIVLLGSSSNTFKACNGFTTQLTRGSKSCSFIGTRQYLWPFSRASEEESNELNKEIEFELHPSISHINATSWDSFLDSSSSPFVQHSWLQCLEESGCASAKTGWMAQHLSIKVEGEVCGYVPMYIKGHSRGEFIFDNAWADAAYRIGIKYYPKLLVGVPFTPATGSRILLSRDIRQSWSEEDIDGLRTATARFLKQLASSNGLSSIHINFLTDEEATSLAGPLLPTPTKPPPSNFARRATLQYHWSNANPRNHNQPFESFDDYLSCFKSKRRISIKRERSKVLQDHNIRVDAVVGRDILNYPGLVERMFQIYKSTIDKMFWGRQYLTLEFFQMLSESEFIQDLCFMCARRNSTETLRAEDVFAGTFNIIHNGVFYGRYWGCLPTHNIPNLHFEVCYWSAIEYCISNKILRMEPGAGGGDTKFARGFDAALIHSVHFVAHPGLRAAVDRFLREERENAMEVTQFLKEKSAVQGVLD